MVLQLSQTWRGRESPGGTRSTSLAPQFEQKFIGGKGILALRIAAGGDDPSILAPVHPPQAVMMTAGLSPPKITLISRISLALLGLMVSLPFLNFHHGLPLPTFYTEWMAFALGTAASLALAFARGKQTGLPLLSLGLMGLTLVLLIQVALGMVAYAERSLLGPLYVLWAAFLVWLGALSRRARAPQASPCLLVGRADSVRRPERRRRPRPVARRTRRADHDPGRALDADGRVRPSPAEPADPDLSAQGSVGDVLGTPRPGRGVR